jgi:hypothetical protein
MNWLSAVRSLNVWVPDNPLVPDQSPDAIQSSALVLDQLNVVESPGATLPGLAEKLSVGAPGICIFTATDTESLALPPGPLQVSV